MSLSVTGNQTSAVTAGAVQVEANVKIYKCLSQIFALALNVSEIKQFYILDLQKVGQDHGVQFWYLHHSMANVKICKWLP